MCENVNNIWIVFEAVEIQVHKRLLRFEPPKRCNIAYLNYVLLEGLRL